MSTDWKALCAELADTLTKYQERLEEDYHPDRPEAKELDAGFRVLERARAALAQPEPVGPTDEEINALADEWWPMDRVDVCHFARAVLARWGRPAITPIPVSERLPVAEDCDAEGRCWFWEPDCGYNGLKWALVDRTYGCNTQESAQTHWLPFHALPFPTP